MKNVDFDRDDSLLLQNDHPDVNVNGDSQGSALAMLPFTLKLL